MTVPCLTDAIITVIISIAPCAEQIPRRTRALHGADRSGQRGALSGSGDLGSTGAYFKIGMRERFQGRRVAFAVVYNSALQR